MKHSLVSVPFVVFFFKWPVMARLNRSQAVQMGMDNALTTPQAAVDKFVRDRRRRSMAVQWGMDNALATPQAVVDKFVSDRLFRSRAVSRGHAECAGGSPNGSNQVRSRC